MLSDAPRIHALPNASDVKRSHEPAHQQHFDDTASIAESVITPLPEPKLPDLDLSSALDLTISLESILATANVAEPE